jgi:dimethylaniline monooxygenase (N-oxide forming)
MLKTLREDGFAVTLFERRSEVGGLWAYTDDTRVTSAVPGTLFQDNNAGNCSY